MLILAPEIMIIKRPIKFDAPATYKIVVQGSLPENFYPCFSGLKIVTEKGKKGVNITFLTGGIKDQAALAGILNILHDYHCPILLVEQIE